MIKKIIALLFPLFISEALHAQTFAKSDVYKAWNEDNLSKLITIHSQSPSLRSLVEEAIGQMNIESLSLSFEELQSYTEQLEKGSPLYNLLINAMKDKKSQVLQQVAVYTPEKLDAYMQQYPAQVQFIQKEIQKAISNSISSVPLNELYYMERTMPYLNHQQIVQETKGRDAERKAILIENLSDYMQKEKEELSYMEYVLRLREHEYFRNKFRNVCIDYASTKQVSPSIYEMETQYKQVVSRHLKPREVQLYLQKEADALCRTVNAARSEYCRAIGKNDFVKLSITIPAPNYNCYISTSALEKIHQAYENYNSSREFINLGGSVAKFLGAGIWASIGEGVAEWFAGSSLADDVTAAQLEYVGDAYKSLENMVKKQIVEANQSISKQITENQKKFIKDVKK